MASEPVTGSGVQVSCLSTGPLSLLLPESPGPPGRTHLGDNPTGLCSQWPSPAGCFVHSFHRCQLNASWPGRVKGRGRIRADTQLSLVKRLFRWGDF